MHPCARSLNLLHLALLGSIIIAAAPSTANSRWAEPVIELTLAGPAIVPHRSMIGAIEASAETWSQVEGSPIYGVFSARGDVAEVAFDGVNAVFFEEEWAGDPGQLALTFSHIQGDEILEIDLAINAEHHAFTTRPKEDWDAFDLENLITHELGHGLGLDHLEGTQASMFRSIEAGETLKRDLEEMDVELLFTLYEDVVLQDVGGCAASGAPPLFMGVFMLLLAALRSRPTSSRLPGS